MVGRNFLLFIILGCLTGCSQEQRDQLADKASQLADQASSKAGELKNKAGEQVSRASEKIVASGSAEFMLDKKIYFPSSYISVVPVEGRGAVVQIKSYPNGSSESFPAYFFQAATEASRVTDLAGQSVTGTLFIKTGLAEPTWVSASPTGISVKLASVMDGKLSGELLSGTMHTQPESSQAVSGQFQCIVEGE